MRCVRGRQLSGIGGDFFLLVHIGAEDFRYCDGAVVVLVEFEYWYEDSGRGDDGVVEGVAEGILFGVRFLVAQLDSSCLEFVEFAC